MVPILGGYEANTELHKSAWLAAGLPAFASPKKLEVEVGHEHFGNVDKANNGCA
jgi:hypothetical protein